MKKKLFLTSLLVFVIVCLFAIGVSAKSYTVNYGGKETAQTDENGVITIRDTAINTNLNKTEYTIKDANGNDTVVTMQFLGWYADDGSTFAPGETVTLTEDIYLYQASGTTVYDYNGLQELLGRDGWYVKLGADITATSKVSTERTGNGNLCVLDLNGFNITSSSSYAFGDQRSGLKILGKGTVTHTGNGGLFSTKRHGSYDGDQRLYIGKKVTVTTSGVLFYTENDLEATDGIYEIRIYGNATAKNVSNLRKLKNASVTVYESAILTLTGNSMFDFDDLTGGEHYMTLSLGGTIKFTNPDSSSIFNDFMLSRQFTIAEITNGSFTVSSSDSEIIAMFLPETLMLKDTENEDGTTTYNVVEADCVHDWVLNIEQSTAATPGATGFNIFDCSKCGTSKRETTVYSPTSVEIEITVDTGDGERTITVLAGDVLDLQFTGTGSSALCYIAGLKDIDKTFANEGEEAARIRFANYVRTSLPFDNYFTIPYPPEENKWYAEGEDPYVTGEKILKNILTSCEYEHNFGDKVIWDFNPTYEGNVEWTYQLNRHHEFRHIAKLYNETGDERYTRAFASLCESFIDQTKWPVRGTPEFERGGGSTNTWRTIEVGIRMASSWPYAIFSFVRSPEVSDKLIEKIFMSVWEQAQRLIDNHTGVNWLIMEMTGLLHSGVLYSFIKESHLSKSSFESFEIIFSFIKNFRVRPECTL